MSFLRLDQNPAIQQSSLVVWASFDDKGARSGVKGFGGTALIGEHVAYRELCEGSNKTSLGQRTESNRRHQPFQGWILQTLSR